jgi:head-tail adaptor
MIEQISHWYTMPIKVLRNVPTDNGMGGWVDHWSTHLNILGWLRPISGNESKTADKLTFHATHRLYCAPDDILVTDRIEDEDEEIYDIGFVHNVMNMGNHLQIDLSKED